MNIREFQEYLVDRLNKVEALLQGGCKAFAEDTRTVYDVWLRGSDPCDTVTVIRSPLRDLLALPRQLVRAHR